MSTLDNITREMVTDAAPTWSGNSTHMNWTDDYQNTTEASAAYQTVRNNHHTYTLTLMSTRTHAYVYHKCWTLCIDKITKLVF